jgi:hypothetical protein
MEDMTEEQRARLTALLPGMLTMARRRPTQNEFAKAMNTYHALTDALAGRGTAHTPEEWIAIAEKAAEGSDKPGVIKGMTLEQIRSGKPPEFFIKDKA